MELREESETTTTETNGREEANKAAGEFQQATFVLEELSRKVSREGLRRVFQAIVSFPYVSKDIDKFNSDFEVDLFSVALRMQQLKGTMNEVMSKDIERINSELIEAKASEGESNG